MQPITNGEVTAPYMGASSSSTIVYQYGENDKFFTSDSVRALIYCYEFLKALPHNDEDFPLLNDKEFNRKSWQEYIREDVIPGIESRKPPTSSFRGSHQKEPLYSSDVDRYYEPLYDFSYIKQHPLSVVQANPQNYFLPNQKFMIRYHGRFFAVRITQEEKVQLFDPQNCFVRYLPQEAQDCSRRRHFESGGLFVTFPTLQHFYTTLQSLTDVKTSGWAQETTGDQLTIFPPTRRIIVAPKNQQMVARPSSQEEQNFMKTARQALAAAYPSLQQAPSASTTHHPQEPRPTTTQESVTSPQPESTKPLKSFTPITMKDIYSIQSTRVPLVLRILAIVSSLLLITIPIIFGIMKLYNRHQEGKETQ